MASSEILEKRRPSKGFNHRLDLHASMCAANRLVASVLGRVARFCRNVLRPIWWIHLRRSTLIAAPKLEGVL